MSDDEMKAMTETLEYVPHKNGILRADKTVVLSIRVTAKERHLWQLAAVKEGTTISDKLRSFMNQYVDEVLSSDDLEHLEPRS